MSVLCNFIEWKASFLNWPLKGRAICVNLETAVVAGVSFFEAAVQVGTEDLKLLAILLFS